MFLNTYSGAQMGKTKSPRLNLFVSLAISSVNAALRDDEMLPCIGRDVVFACVGKQKTPAALGDRGF